MELCDAKRITAVVLIILLLSIASLPFVVNNTEGKGDDSGVSVKNVSPNIHDADLEKNNKLYRLEVMASDFNGWQDIKTINISIINKQDEVIASGGYYQYKEGVEKPRPDYRVDKFENYKNDPLMLEKCSVERNISHKETIKKTRMELDFSFYVEGGWTILLNISDMRDLHATMRVTFPSILSGIYNISQYLVIIALGTASVATYIKFKDVEWMEVIKGGG